MEADVNRVGGGYNPLAAVPREVQEHYNRTYNEASSLVFCHHCAREGFGAPGANVGWQRLSLFEFYHFHWHLYTLGELKLFLKLSVDVAVC